MVPDLFLEYERLMNTTHVFFWDNLVESRRAPCGWTDFLGHQIDLGIFSRSGISQKRNTSGPKLEGALLLEGFLSYAFCSWRDTPWILNLWGGFRRRERWWDKGQVRNLGLQGHQQLKIKFLKFVLPFVWYGGMYFEHFNIEEIL